MIMHTAIIIDIYHSLSGNPFFPKSNILINYEIEWQVIQMVYLTIKHISPGTHLSLKSAPDVRAIRNTPQYGNRWNHIVGSDMYRTG